tara:strand:- start:254 stop:391 length:138 start_codon:yes stop_codon:yes gene_type:complete
METNCSPDIEARDEDGDTPLLAAAKDKTNPEVIDAQPTEVFHWMM